MKTKMINADDFEPPPLKNAPLLVYTHESAKFEKIQTFCTISPLPPNNETYLKDIYQLHDKFIMGCFHDWLILRDLYDKKMFSLWNIVTLQDICFDRLNTLDIGFGYDGEVEDISACVLMSTRDDGDNDNDNSAVLFLFNKSIVYSCRVEGDKALYWAEQSTELEGETVEIDTVVVCNGVLYGWAQTDCGRVLITIEFEGDDSNRLIFKSLRLKPPEFGLCFHSSKGLDYLVESCDQLYMVSIWIWQAESMHVSKVKVWELDLNQMGWVEVECLGNRAFFLGLYWSTWCWGSTDTDTLEGNCVYFVLENDETLYSYRLKDNSFAALLTCPNLVTPFYGPAWIMTQHQRSLPRKEPGKSSTIIEKVDVLNQSTNVIKHEEVQEQNFEKQEKSLSALAPDTISSISKYLHFFDYLNFRASCKAFQSTVPPAQSCRNNSFPLFMFSKNGNGLCELTDINRNNSHSIVIPHSPSPPTSIEFSKDGWLIACTGTESLQFFNLFTRIKGEFPPCDYIHKFASVGFSTCPTSSDCVTVGIIDDWECIMINYIQSSDDKWHQCEFRHEGVEFTPSRCSPVYQNGAFYFLDQIGFLGVFELVKGEVNWQVYNGPPTGNEDYDSCHLLECDKELISVFFGKMGKWVQLFRFNHSSKQWVKLKSLEDHILFIGPSSSFSAIAKERELKNRIYLPRLKGNDIVFYSLDTGKYHTAGDNEDSLGDFYGMRRHSLCCWI